MSRDARSRRFTPLLRNRSETLQLVKEVEDEHQSRCLPEQVERHRSTHLVITARAGMDAVSAVERRVDQVGVPGILHHLVEVDHRIEWRLGADPLVDLVADLASWPRSIPVLFSAGGRLCRGIIVAPTIFMPRAFTRLTMSSVPAMICAGRCLPADVVGAHEQDDVRHAMVGQHVALEPLEAGRAVGRRLETARA